MRNRIPLHGRGGEVRAYALVDPEDYALPAARNWSLNAGGYAHGWDVDLGMAVLMHRVILGLPVGDPRVCDHINRDKLDNRRSNLRVIDRAANRQNVDSLNGSSSRFRGVTWHKKRGKWIAKSRLRGRTFHHGEFDDEAAAAAASAAFRALHMPFSAEAQP